MKNVFSTSLVVLATSMTPLALYANDYNNCDIEIDGGVNINQQTIAFVDDDKKPRYSIVDDNSLFIKGEKFNLNKQQQTIVTQYAQNIRALVPEVKNLALDAVKVASEGVNLAFNELLGEGNQVGNGITSQLDEIHQEIESSLSIEQGISIDENGLNGDDFLGDDFEQRIEQVVAKAIESSMGALMMAVGQQMMSSGGDMKAFGEKMENFGDKIEYELETRANQLESRANKLCQSVVALDVLEAKLHTSITELKDFDFLTASYKERN